jgi:hypothetical protein
MFQGTPHSALPQRLFFVRFSERTSSGKCSRFILSLKPPSFLRVHNLPKCILRTSYRGSYTIKKGESKFEPRISDASNPKFVDGVTNVPNQGPESVGYAPREDVTLSWPTFTAAAEEAGASRLVGGIHIAAGNDGGLDLGTMVGEAVWKRYKGLVRHQKEKSYDGLRSKHKMSMKHKNKSTKNGRKYRR